MRENMEYPRILLADDFPLYLQEVEKLLRNDYDIVGFAHDGGEALNLCLALSPDILLLDLAMPVLCGLEVAARLKELDCGSRIIFVTGQEDHDFVETAFSLGASGYVLKCRIAIDVLPDIDAALKGSTFTSPFPARVYALHHLNADSLSQRLRVSLRVGGFLYECRTRDLCVHSTEFEFHAHPDQLSLNRLESDYDSFRSSSK